LTHEQWGKVANGETIPGFEPSAKEPDSIPTIQASPGFRKLLRYGRFLTGCGWVLIVFAAIILVGGLLRTKNGVFTGVTGAIAFAINGMLFVVAGQVISCFVLIEKNTRETNELLRQLKN
jgi:hypothetical protein